MLPRFEHPVALVGAVANLPTGVRSLMELESAEFAAVLGQPLVLDPERAGQITDVWLVNIDPSSAHARLEADPLDRRLVMTIAAPDELGAGLNLLHSLAHEPGVVVSDAEVDSYPEVFDRVRAEIDNIYPSFGLRGLDWEAICERHCDLRNREGDQFWAGALRWIAELGDAHTQLVFPGMRHHPPYVARMASESAVLITVPVDSATRDGSATSHSLPVEVRLRIRPRCRSRAPTTRGRAGCESSSTR